MAKKRIEVCRERDTAERRAEWMRQQGYKVDDPANMEKVIWNALDVTGKTDTAFDEDGEVWVVIGDM